MLHNFPHCLVCLVRTYNTTPLRINNADVPLQDRLFGKGTAESKFAVFAEAIFAVFAV